MIFLSRVLCRASIFTHIATLFIDTHVTLITFPLHWSGTKPADETRVAVAANNEDKGEVEVSESTSKEVMLLDIRDKSITRASYSRTGYTSTTM